VAIVVAVLPGIAAAQLTGPPAAARIELQIGVCAPPEAVVRALAAKEEGARRDVWFFDDTALALHERGVRLRLRVEDKKGELVLKVANQDCALVAPGLIPRGEGKCEYDRHGDRVAGAVSLGRGVDAKTTRRLVAGKWPVAKALTPAQAHYLRDVVRAWPLPAGIRPLGPVGLQQYRAADRSWDVDVWTLPRGGGHVEVSRKVPLADGERAYADMRAELARAGVPACADQSAQSLNTLRALAAPR
jgi:hypothetical protein